jgi:elongation factor Ts
MAITTEQVKKLREMTGAGILDCQKALTATNGDMDKAMDILREKGLAAAQKRADRQASEGMLELYSHSGGRIGVMVELNCETDFVARADEFRKLAHELALQIAATAPIYIREEDIPADVLEHEKKIYEAKAKEEGKPAAILERIVEGNLNKYKDETVLLRQPYIRDESLTVQKLINEKVVALGENVVVRRFVRWVLGEASVVENKE